MSSNIDLSGVVLSIAMRVEEVVIRDEVEMHAEEVFEFTSLYSSFPGFELVSIKPIPIEGEENSPREG